MNMLYCKCGHSPWAHTKKRGKGCCTNMNIKEGRCPCQKYEEDKNGIMSNFKAKIK